MDGASRREQIQVITAEQARLAFARTAGDAAPSSATASAAVAAILRETGSGLELLFIERARCPGDPWSGDLAFPGGRLEEGDADLRATAERETLEEIGLDLAAAESIGRLSDLTTAHQQMVIAAFVYYLGGREPDGESALQLSSEVADAFWFPLMALLEPGRQASQTFETRGMSAIYPTIDLLGTGRPVLWGVTHRLVSRLLQCLGCSLPAASTG